MPSAQHRRLQHGEVGGDGGTAQARLRYVEHLAARRAEPAGQARSLAQGVHEEHSQVTPAAEGATHQLRPTEHDHGGVARNPIGEDERRGVGLELVGHPPHLLLGIGAGQYPARQPPQGPYGRMPVDQPSACRDERGRIVGESRQRVRGLRSERRRTGSVSPGHVPEPLDRMHRGDLTNGHP